MSDSFRIEMEEKTRIRTASAVIRGDVIQVRLPRHWPKKDKLDIATRLIQRVKNKRKQQEKLLDSLKTIPTITLSNHEALSEYVDVLNQATFQAPLKKVRIGNAKYSRLAQVNVRTGVMTVSKYCLTNVPAPALRYLIIHELAHFTELGHNQRFWSLVARFVPDYKYQSKLIKAFHRHAIEQDPLNQPTPLPPAPPPNLHPDHMEDPIPPAQLSLFP